MKKMAVSGKGGSGKSSTVALLAKVMRDKAYRVLVVDSDESNPGPYRTLSLAKRPAPLLELVGGKGNVFDTFSDGSAPPHSILTRKTITTEDIPADGVFIYIGMIPKTKAFADHITLDERGYIVTDERERTNVPGVFAAGDVQNSRLRQVVMAASEGARAAVEVDRLLAAEETPVTQTKVGGG